MALSYFHVTPAGAGLKDGSTWLNAMGEAEFETHLEGSAASEFVYFIQAGTYTMNSSYDSSARGGSGPLTISIIGVKAATTNEGASIVYSDWGQGADRPFFDGGQNWTIRVGNYYVIRNIYIQSGGTNTLQTAAGCIIENCKLDNNYTIAAARYALNVGSQSIIVNCELTSAKCRGITTANTGIRIIGCYFNSFPDAGGIGISMSVASIVVLFCFFRDIGSTAVNIGGGADCTIMNNTFYGCATDVSGTGAYSLVAMNNLHEGTTVDAYNYSAQTNTNFIWNNWGNDARCTDMWTGFDTTTIFQDYPNATLNGDPLFSSAGSSAALSASSPCLNTGMSLTLGV